MKAPTSKTLTQVLDSLSRRDCLQCLVYVQARQARDAVILDLLQTRLRHLTSAPTVTMDHDTLLTVPDVAEALKVKKARAYELIRAREISAVRVGQRQVRVRRRDLAQYLDDHRAQKDQ